MDTLRENNDHLFGWDLVGQKLHVRFKKIYMNDGTYLGKLKIDILPKNFQDFNYHFSFPFYCQFFLSLQKKNLVTFKTNLSNVQNFDKIIYLLVPKSTKDKEIYGKAIY